MEPEPKLSQIGLCHCDRQGISRTVRLLFSRSLRLEQSPFLCATCSNFVCLQVTAQDSSFFCLLLDPYTSICLQPASSKCLSVSVPLSVSVALSLCLSLSVSVSLCLCLSLSLFLSVSVSLSKRNLHRYVTFRQIWTDLFESHCHVSGKTSVLAVRCCCFVTNNNGHPSLTHTCMRSLSNHTRHARTHALWVIHSRTRSLSRNIICMSQP